MWRDLFQNIMSTNPKIRLQCQCQVRKSYLGKQLFRNIYIYTHICLYKKLFCKTYSMTLALQIHIFFNGAYRVWEKSSSYIYVGIDIYIYIFCTELWGKELHRQVGGGMVVTYRKPTWCNGSKLVRNARNVNSILTLGTIFPIYLTPMTYIYIYIYIIYRLVVAF